MRVPLTDVRLTDTHRLIPTRFSRKGSVLSRLTRSNDRLKDLQELDTATNDRLLGEQGLLPGIGIHELVYGVAYAPIVNAAFTHSSPAGGRFNGSGRGAWYAGVERETAILEVSFHKREQLAEVGWTREEASRYDDYLADFTCGLRDLRLPQGMASKKSPGPSQAMRTNLERYLQPDPVPECYGPGQGLANKLLQEQGNGVIYPSVRNKGGTCVACFRPPLVYNVRLGGCLEITVSTGRAFSNFPVKEIKSRRDPYSFQ